MRGSHLLWISLFTFSFTESRKICYQLSSLKPFRSCILNGFLAFQHIINQRFVHKFCAPSTINFYIVDVSFSCFQKETTPTTLFHLFSTIFTCLLVVSKTPTSKKTTILQHVTTTPTIATTTRSTMASRHRPFLPRCEGGRSGVAGRCWSLGTKRRGGNGSFGFATGGGKIFVCFCMIFCMFFFGLFFVCFFFGWLDLGWLFGMMIDLFGWLELVKLLLDVSFVNVFFLVGLKGVD